MNVRTLNLAPLLGFLVCGAPAFGQEADVNSYVGTVVGLSAKRDCGPVFALNKKDSYVFPAGDWSFSVCQRTVPPAYYSDCGKCYDLSEIDQRKLETSFRTGQEVKIGHTPKDQVFDIESVDLVGDEIAESTDWLRPSKLSAVPMIARVPLSNEYLEYVRHNGLEAGLLSSQMGDEISPFRFHFAIDYNFDEVADLRLVGCLGPEDKDCVSGTTLSTSQTSLLVDLVLSEPFRKTLERRPLADDIRRLLKLDKLESEKKWIPRIRIRLDYLEWFATETPKIREIGYFTGM